ncbi:MAG: hypothetical protein WDO13_16945 [Verrucomicrobiota bacterium]
MWLNFDDNFSIHRRLFPRYGQNLAAIARIGRRREPDFPVIDIGASFGDGVAGILEQVKVPLLAIEPSVKFELLRRNFGNEPGVELERAFVADASPAVARPRSPDAPAGRGLAGGQFRHDEVGRDRPDVGGFQRHDRRIAVQRVTSNRLS